MAGWKCWYCEFFERAFDGSEWGFCHYKKVKVTDIPGGHWEENPDPPPEEIWMPHSVTATSLLRVRAKANCIRGRPY